MSTLTIIDDEFVECDGCDVTYSVVFNVNAIYNKIEYCPFCGDEIHEIKEQDGD